MKSQDLKIIYFGTSDFAVPALKYLIQNGYKISAVVTQSEKPVGRAKVIIPSPVKKFCIDNQILVLEPHNLKNDDDSFRHFKKIYPDLCIVAAYGKIIPPQYLEVPRYGFINIHPSLLPKYRGPSPIQTGIMNGDIETGVAIMKVDEDMDHGPVLEIMDYKFNTDNYYKKTEEDLAKLGAELLLEVLPKYIAGEIKLKEQDHSKATFTKLLTRNDGRINWDKNAEEIYNQIRALNPEPGTWTTWKGKNLNIKVAELSELQVSNEESGLISNINNNIVVSTRKYYLILRQIQLEGGKEMDVKIFLNGHPDFLGSKLI